MIDINRQERDKDGTSIKSVLILMPLTIPATGKSTVFNLMRQRVKKIKIEILGSDIMRGQKMKELLSKNRNMQKQQAYLLTKKQADSEFYIRLQHILEQACHNSQSDHTAVVLDKNYSLVTFREAIQQIKRIAQKYEKRLVTKIIAVVPKCKTQLRLNQQIIYPFSSCYIACCMKRVLLREKHQTLEGAQIKRAITCIGWANNFRNINIKQAIELKLFDGVINVQFTKEQELPVLIEQYMKQFLISAKVNCFQVNEGSILPKLIQQLKSWKNQQIQPKDSLEQVQQNLNALFL